MSFDGRKSKENTNKMTSQELQKVMFWGQPIQVNITGNSQLLYQLYTATQEMQQAIRLTVKSMKGPMSPASH